MFTDANRAHFQEMRALAVDRAGNEHLVGLTIEETAFYLNYAATRAAGGFTSSDDSDHYLALHDRHERALRCSGRGG
jgi:hypothetical protein